MLKPEEIAGMAEQSAKDDNRFADAMRLIQLEADNRSLHNAALQVRQFLAGALCAECGEPLGTEEEIISDDDDRTIHKHCEGK